MISAFVIVLREAFEASLVLSLVFAFLSKLGRMQDSASAVWAGAAAAVALSAVLGGLLFVAGGELEGTAEALYEGCAMLLAALVLTGMLFWMRRQAASIGGQLRAQVSDALSDGSRIGLALVAFVAVAREGFETALFLFAGAGEDGAVGTFLGGLAGLVAAVALGILLYRGSLQLDLGRFFLITGMLVILFAAYLLAGGLGELGEAAGSEAGELAGLVAGVAYALGFGVVYWRSARPRPRRGAAAQAAG